ncbi:MAG TPA: ATP-binding protein, partial [Myxococcaceae bacterium]|nr:ATP-binding protein [Myxococcaceae bacterium]
QCKCLSHRVHDYHTRVSGPLLDRIDITLQTRAVEYGDMARVDSTEPSSAHYRLRVEEARERQRHRFRGSLGVHCNAQMSPRLLRRHCRMTDRARQMLKRAMEMHGLSARAHDRILKVARTRADLEGHEQIEDADMNLAIDCRMLDRKSWLNSGTFQTPARR